MKVSGRHTNKNIEVITITNIYHYSVVPGITSFKYFKLEEKNWKDQVLLYATSIYHNVNFWRNHGNTHLSIGYIF